MGTIEQKLQYLLGTKQAIRQAIEAKGVEVTDEDTFRSYAGKINLINTGQMISPKNVNFYDYDGSLIYAYTTEEALALTEMPPLPTQIGLICQEWNYTFEEMMFMTQDCGNCDIGATYITDNGETRLYMEITSLQKEVSILIYQTISEDVVVDWGDGSEQSTVEGTGNKTFAHNYVNEGNYIIRIDSTLGTYSFASPSSSGGSQYANFLGNSNNSLKKVEYGARTTSMIANNVFNKCFSLETITIPRNFTTIGSSGTSYALDMVPSLRALILPRSVTTIQTNAIYRCQGMTVLSIPPGVVSLQMALYYTPLKRLVVPHTITTLSIASGNNNAHILEEIIIPPSAPVTTPSISGCTSIRSLTMPKKAVQITANNQCGYNLNCEKFIFLGDVTKIGASSGSYATFIQSYGAKLYDFRNCSAVPTLASSGQFPVISSSKGKIVVPDELYDAWVTATNWSAYASYIVKSSDFADYD